MKLRFKNCVPAGALLTWLVVVAPASAATFDVCENPGECDFTRIQAAVNGARDGDTVEVEEGRYKETVRVRNQIELRGAQDGADARDSRRGGESIVGAQNGGFVIESDRVVISGFTISGGGANGGPSTFDAGIDVPANRSGLRIVDNVITDNVLGLQLNSTGARTIVRRNSFIANNNDGGEGEEQGNGIYTDGTVSNVLIDRNDFTGHQNEAILLANAGGVGTGIDITGNKLTRDSGVVVVNARAVRVSENTSDGNVDDDVIDDDVIEMGGNVDGANITDNTLRQYEGAGIVISNDRLAGINRNISIIGNTLLGERSVSSDRGVRLLGDTYDGRLQVNFNRIFANDFGIANEDSDAAEQINAENNWWGSNSRPGTPPSDSVVGNVDTGPRLTLRLISKRSVKRDGRQLKVAASLQFNSGDDGAVQRFNPSPFPNRTTIEFDTSRGRIEKRSRTVNGVARGTLISPDSRGRATVSISLDGETVRKKIRIR